MNILLTGGSGSIGLSLIELLRKKHNKVYILGRTPLSLPNVYNISIDLSCNWNIEQLPSDVDMIIHLAQSENFRQFPEKATDIFQVNTYSTLKLAEYALKVGVKKFLYASSGGIYGNRDKGFEEEEQIPTDNLGFYLGTKLCSEIILDSYKRYIDVHLLRLFFVYGPHQEKTMLIPRLIENIRNNEPIQLLGENGIKINPIYVDDAANAIEKCIYLNGSHKINIAGNEILSIKQISEIIGAKLNKQPSFSYQIQNSETKNLIGNTTRMRKLLVSPQISFEQGINELIYTKPNQVYEKTYLK